MTERKSSGAAVGFLLFATLLLGIVGFFQVLWGINALARPESFTEPDNYLFVSDVTAWGWVHLIGGLMVLVASFFLYSGAVWARTVGVIVAALSAITSFLTIAHHPMWSIVIMALDVGAIWALTTHGHERQLQAQERSAAFDEYEDEERLSNL